LELRATLAVDLLAKVASRLGTPEFATVHAAVDAFDRCVQASAPVEEIITRDLAVVRALLALVPQVAFSTVFNGFEALIRTLPELQEALYSEPTINVAGWRYTFETLGDDDFLSTLRPLLHAIDTETLDRFEKLLEVS
jgi:hypothetical protein